MDVVTLAVGAMVTGIVSSIGTSIVTQAVTKNKIDMLEKHYDFEINRLHTAVTRAHERINEIDKDK